jgi:hypothetical protein
MRIAIPVDEQNINTSARPEQQQKRFTQKL